MGRRLSLKFAAILPFSIAIAMVFAPPAGMAQMQILAWFVLALAGGMMAWLVGASRIDRGKADALRRAAAEAR